MSRQALDPRSAPASYLPTVLGTFAAVGAIGGWLFVSYFLWLIRCDDVCSGNDADRWQWTGQFYLAVPGCALALVALVLCLAGLRSASRMALIAAVSFAVLWLGLLSTF